MKILSRAWQKIQAYTNAADGEISGLAKIGLIGGSVAIVDAVIVEQEATAATVEAPAASVVKFFSDNPAENPADWLVQWHSHDTMQCFFSPVDVNNIEEVKNTPARFSLVVNKQGEHKLRLDYFYKSSHYLTVEDDLQIISDIDQELTDACIAEVKAKVKKPEYKAPKNNKLAPVVYNNYKQEDLAVGDIVSIKYAFNDLTLADDFGPDYKLLDYVVIEIENVNGWITISPLDKPELESYILAANVYKTNFLKKNDQPSILDINNNQPYGY